MPSVSINFDTARYSESLEDMAARYERLETIMDDLAEYLVRSIRHRLLRSKTSPSGERWAANRKVTVDLKGGRDSILFDSGDLARSITVDRADGSGFTVSAHADHASYMQYGVASTGGMIKGKQIPARPFMGFSDANRRRIAKALKSYIEDGDINLSGVID